MTRYDLITNYRCGSSIEEMERADDGDWVRYEDINTTLIAQQKAHHEEVQKVTAEQGRRAFVTALTEVKHTRNFVGDDEYWFQNKRYYTIDEVFKAVQMREK